MKLIYIANIRFPTEKAHGLQIAQMCQAFSQLNVDVTLIVPNRKSHSHLKTNPQTLYSLPREIPTKKLFCLDFLQFFSVSDPQTLKQLSFFLQSFSFSFSLLIFLSKTPLKQIIYSRNVLVVFPSLILKRSFFLELHSFPQTRIGRLIHKLAFTKVQGAIFISKSLRDLYIRSNIVPKQHLIAHDAASLIPSSTKLSKIQARKKLKLPFNKKIVLYTGSFFPWKGVYKLLEATKQLPKNSLTIFIGGSPIEPSTKKFFAKASLPKYHNTLVFNHTLRANLQLYLKSADVLVLPTTTKSPHAFYNSPLKLFDYLASGKPIVATNLPSIREILDENCAILVRPNSHRALSDGIIKLLSNPQLAKSLTSNAYKKSKPHTWKNRARSISSFIRASMIYN